MWRLSLLLLLVNQERAISINVDESCTCIQIKSKSDCANMGCKWNDNKCVQNDLIKNEDTISVYCRSFDEQKCGSIKGCAWIDNQCEQFSGCSAYMGSSNDLCQQISQECTSDGKQCMDRKDCNDYKGQIDCNSNMNKYGGYCRWENNECRDQKCIEASNDLKTDFECNKFKLGCLTNGKGCVEIRKECSTYGIEECNQMIGKEGYCIRTVNGCGMKECQSASIDYIKDEQCGRYQIGCITTGKGCWQNPLPTCDNYVGNECDKMKGSDGQCENGLNNKCQSRRCENAPLSYDSDEKCKQYLNTCITKGRGCDTQLRLCSSYSGTFEECNKYIGIDGKCSFGSIGCKVRVCEEASFKTDKECNEYQKGCITDGVNCVSTRKLCSTYNGTSITCSKYQGSDGRCYSKNNTDEGPCSNLVCTDAPTNYKTHEQCISFQSDCLTNGQGCVKQTNCLSTIAEITCKATSSCQWNQVCVTKTNCSFFNNISLCNNNLANDKPCFWVNGICRIRLCNDAPNYYNKDDDCKKFLNGCLTNSQGCLPATSPCNQYNGTQDTCSNFKGNGIKCTRNSTLIGPCENLQCSNNTTAINQKQCDDFLKGCQFQGTAGCIDQSANCNSYTGNQQMCSSYFGINGTIKCYQDTGLTASCRNLLCSDNITATSDEQCKSFLYNCVFKGIGCIDQAEPCSSYSGNNINDCSKFKGLNNTKQCWWVSGSTCVNKECIQDTLSINNLQCEQFLSGCVTKGIGCIENTQLCTAFQGDETQCSNFIGSGKPCVRKNACINRSCSDVINPSNNDQCTAYMPTCRFNGFLCIDAQVSCLSYIGLNYQICQQITTISGGKCYLANGTGTCQTRSCSHLTSANNQNDCDQFLSGCIFSGSNCISQQNLCNQYINFQPNQCEKAESISTGLCWRQSNSVGTCMARTCLGITNASNPYSFSSQFCMQYSNTCIYDGVKCVDKQTNCNSYTNFLQSACKSAVTSAGEKCWLENSTLTTCESRQCTNTVTTPNQINCQAHKSSCRYNGTLCVEAQTACNLYNPFTQQACRDVKLADGVGKCWRTSNSNGACEDRQCANITVGLSAQKCLDHLNTCRFNGSSCVIYQTNCNQYLGFTAEACKQVTTNSGGLCWIPVSGSTQCSERSCNNTIENANEINCPNHLSSCRFNGVGCVDNQAQCNLYTGFTKSACQSTTNTSGNFCWKQTNEVGICEDRSCSNIIENANYVNCGMHLSICTYDGQNCFTKQSTCNLYVGVSETQCQNLRTTTGDRCWFVSGNCVQRICSQNQTGMTDIECNEFLPGCRTTGKGCVDSTVTCSEYKGTISSCLGFVGNGIKCKGQDSFGFCEQKQCQDDMNSTTDVECDAFMKGCVTRGQGCINKDESCNNYVGNQSICSKFIGDGKKCWSDSLTTIQQCRVRLCSDNQIYNTDTQCQEFQVGCVSKGRGCINYNAKCSEYQGTQTECSLFKGQNGSKACWNVITATPLTNCIDRVCSHNSTAKSDNECQKFLKGCVSKGIGCVSPQQCSQFNGTIRSCPLFTATDKPCKGTSDTSVTPCVALKCNEAPNNYDSDELCNIFKEGCVTNGYGCVNTVSCEEIQTQKACQSKKQCSYSGNCTQLSNSCSIFKSQSICVNTPVYTEIGRCSWESNQTSNIGFCRDWKCEDASESLLTHIDCQRMSQLCTSKGKGCIQMGICSSYTDANSCSFAQTTDEGGLCIWEKTFCRKLECSDASKEFTTDEKCKEFLNKCYSNGQGCINSNYICEDIIVKSKCTNDHLGNPCLWFQQKCITYSQCIDIEEKSHNLCQQYSNKCTSNGLTCIPITFCSKYTNQISCSLGIDGKCGWMEPICTQFTKCSDFIASTTALCQQYSDLCISDGFGCISKTNCINYQNEESCNSGGIDGICIWNQNSCRLRLCNDAAFDITIDISQHSSCNNFIASTKCTTNGTNCVSMALCSSYKEPGCHYGTDGQCIYTYQEGQTQGFKQCRVKTCSDYQDTTTDKCKQNKKVCISNGKNCILKNKCQTYKTKIACNSGGLDGICVFTPSIADTNKGTCALMTTCEQANSDSIACKLKSNSCHFLVSLQNGIEVTSCINHTCATVAKGAVCNPLISFDEKKITVCVMTSSGCVQGSPNQLSASNCLQSSFNIFTWNAENNLCQKCNESIITPNTPTNTTNKSQDTFSKLLLFSFLIIIQ
ncbi:unnamed protein product [Paramecium sonneborni]|uniref:Uncharacterized protein n=1 Tax=Paramecium sonneborni TaxID=65129 RepID=A0A8S1MBG8_9CILI|nr:unnamed protein product [Paramecium sonneborni]